MQFTNTLPLFLLTLSAYQQYSDEQLDQLRHALGIVLPPKAEELSFSFEAANSNNTSIFFSSVSVDSDKRNPSYTEDAFGRETPLGDHGDLSVHGDNDDTTHKATRPINAHPPANGTHLNGRSPQRFFKASRIPAKPSEHSSSDEYQDGPC